MHRLIGIAIYLDYISVADKRNRFKIVLFIKRKKFTVLRFGIKFHRNFTVAVSET